MKSSLKGFVEKIGSDTVIGWAFDQSAIGTSVRVEARADNKCLASAVANISRDDLLAMGLGNGQHGFSIRISEDTSQLLNRGHAKIWVSSATQETWQPLPFLNEHSTLIHRFQRAVNGIRKLPSISGSTSGLVDASHLSQTTSPHTAKTFMVNDGLATLDAPAESPAAVQQAATRFEVEGRLFGAVDEAKQSHFTGWMLDTRINTTPLLLVNGLPVSQSSWPLARQDVNEHYGIERRCGFRFEYNAPPGAEAQLLAYDGMHVIDVLKSELPSDTHPQGLSLIRQIMDDAAKPDAVAITCWDGAHNPVGRAKVLYDILDGRRPVWLFCYLFEEFGGQLWAPLADSNLRIMTIPWRQRTQYHRLFQTYGIRFPTVWMCKPRLPTLLLASVLAAPDARLLLDFDDNEEHFSKSAGSVGKPYGGDSIGLVRKLIEDVTARTAASKSLAEDFQAEIVRHARRPSLYPTTGSRDTEKRPIRIGFIGTVRPHKRIIEAAQAIRITNNICGQPIEFHVHGDIRPDDYRRKLEANGVVTNGTVLSKDLESTLQTFDVVLTGYPSQSDRDEAITRYQISSKIGDALANGIPALVPRSRSVEDLEGIPGVYLFEPDTFVETLMKAIRSSKRVKLPYDFTLEGAYDSFQKAEAAAPKDISSLRSIAPIGQPDGQQSVLLLWKQQDGGLYGRRVDQIARAIKAEIPNTTVRIVEFMNDAVKKDLQSRSEDLMSDARLILNLSDRKSSGNAVTPEGIVYNQLAVKSDADAPKALMEFLWQNGHRPTNTLMIVFPAFSLLNQCASIIDPFPTITDVVDNQLSWGNNMSRGDLISQYLWLLRKAEHVVFNSEANLKFFQDGGFLRDTPSSQVSVVPNWYVAPAGSTISCEKPPEARNGVVNMIYSGNLNDRIDWSLMKECAQIDFEICLHIVGDGSRAGDSLRALLELPNVVYYGPMSETRVCQLMQKMHFAILPHAHDSVSAYMNPLKVLMYRAQGLRTIAIAVPGLNDIDGLTTFNDPAEFLREFGKMADLALNGKLQKLTPIQGIPPNSCDYVKTISKMIS